MKMDVLFEQNELERRTMMKKVLALVLVLSMAGIASAGYQIAMPDKVNVLTDATFQIVIGGAAAEAYDGGVYGYLMPASYVVSTNAGNLGKVNEFPDYGGIDFSVGDLQGAGVKAGEWVTLTYNVGKVGEMATFNFFDYAISYDQAVSTRTVQFVPEPMTLSLLGLGALVLRRRS